MNKLIDTREKYKSLGKLGDLCRTSSGGTPSRDVSEFYNGQIPWVKSGELSDEHIYITEECISETAITNSSAKIFPRGTLLIAMYGASVGKLGVLGIDAATNQAVCAIFPGEELDRNFLFYYLLFKRNTLIENRIGGAQPNISQNIIRGLDVPVPPLPEQKRIAAILEKVDRVRRLRCYARNLSDTFLQSVFLEMFGDPILTPKDWKVVRIGDVVSSSQYGTSQRSNNEMIGYPIIGMGNVTENGRLEFESLSYVDISPAEFDKLKLEKGDVIFNRTNSTELVGKTALWNIDLDAVIASYLVKIRLINDILPTYFVALLNTPSYKQFFQLRCRKAVGQSNISPTLLKEFNIPLPPLVAQKTFQRIVSKFEDMPEYYREAERQGEQLFQSILYRAFRGEK